VPQANLNRQGIKIPSLPLSENKQTAVIDDCRMTTFEGQQGPIMRCVLSDLKARYVVGWRYVSSCVSFLPVLAAAASLRSVAFGDLKYESSAVLE
jgi:hypothetical protein